MATRFRWRLLIVAACLSVSGLVAVAALHGAPQRNGAEPTPTPSVDSALADEKQQQVDDEQAALEEASKLASQPPTPDYDALQREILKAEVTSCPRVVETGNIQAFEGRGNPAPQLDKTNFVTLPSDDAGEYRTVYAGAFYDKPEAGALVLQRSPKDYCASGSDAHLGADTYVPPGFVGALTITAASTDGAAFVDTAGQVGEAVIVDRAFLQASATPTAEATASP